MILPWSRTSAWTRDGLAERAGPHELIAELVRPGAGPPGDGGMNHGRRESDRPTARR